MRIFEGKTPTEKKKIIAAGVLCAVSLLSLYLAFGRGLFGSSAAKVTVTVSPTPKPGSSPKSNSDDLKMPSPGEQNFDYETTEVVYNPGRYGAPGAGRNIFAFYEPPPPTPWSPTPVYVPPPVTPKPTPTPDFDIRVVNPASVYAGSKGFRLDIAGDKFTPDARIYFSQSEVPTTFVNPQRLVADVPANFIAQEGPRQIIIQTPDGKKHSNQMMLNVQPPPKPAFVYVGAMLRKRSNNDTATFREEGKPEFSARLSDVIGGRFRLISISSSEAILEDVNLGFRHKLPLFRPAPGTAASSGGRDSFPNNGGFPNSGFVPFSPNPNAPQQQSIPGIPDTIPRYIPPNANVQALPPGQRQQQQKKDDDDDDDGDN